jgi:hypothetical protein
VEIVRAHLQEPARRIVDSLIDAAWQHCRPHPPPDDLTAIAIKVARDFECAPAPAGRRQTVGGNGRHKHGNQAFSVVGVPQFR